MGQPGWRVDAQRTRGSTARLTTSLAVDAPAFPFPHRIEVAVSAREDRLVIDTTIVPTGRRRVPVAFGWHPYLRVPGAPRSRWQLRLPARGHLAFASEADGNAPLVGPGDAFTARFTLAVC